MKRLAAAAVLLALAASQPPASSAAPEAACRVDTVVDEMARQIRARDYYATIDPRLVTEQATPVPNLVRCNVCVLETPYDMTRFGEKPVRRCLPHDFEVKILSTGFVVRDLR